MLAVSLRARLDSFAHAYAVAIRLREATGCQQFIIRCACQIQPVRVSMAPPIATEQLMALVA